MDERSSMGSGSGVCQRCGQSGVTPAAAIHAEDATTSVQGTAFRTRDHHAVRATVSPVFTELSNLEELMAERNLALDHVTIWRWVQRYAPELDRRCRRELRMTNRSWRVDETYVRIAGRWTYLYRGADSVGDTIDFLLSSNRDAQAAKRFFQKALRSLNHPRPRGINVDGNPSYPKVITELRRTGELGRRCRRWPIRYLNKIVEQDHRAIKRRVRASQGFRSFESA
jgi:IS6 family transposase